MNGELVWIDHDALAKLGRRPLERARRDINGLVHKKILTQPDVRAGEITTVESEIASGQLPEHGTFILVALDRDEPPPKLEVVE